MTPKTSWHTKTPAEIFTKIDSHKHGLTETEATRRLQEYGLNKLPESSPVGIGIIFLNQFRSPLIYLLLAASLAVFMLGEISDGLVLLTVLVFNSVIGTLQEGRTQNALHALKRFAETQAAVIRDGKEVIVSDTQIVPGDIVILHEGTKVPADSRIILSHNLAIDEAGLTGESEPSHKTTEVISGDTIALLEQKNMAFKGTPIVAGNGEAVVVATGMETVIGQIAKEISDIDTEIPLKTNIRNLSRLIIYIVTGICAGIFLLGLFYGRVPKDMFITAVSLSVSAIPEGLPVVLTLILATGVWRMSKRNILVKKLQAVEGLGQARVIAVDKTGTITKNEMMIQQVYTGGKQFEVEGVGYEPKGEIHYKGQVIDPLNHPELILAGKMAAFCSNARIMFSEQSHRWNIAGDPTEAAMLVFAQKLGFHKDDLERESPLIAEIPFDYAIKYHATVHAPAFLSVIGAPETVLALCQKAWHGGKNHELTPEARGELESIFIRMLEKGLRVVAFAHRNEALDILEPKSIRDLTFVGFFGMQDTIRPEVNDAMNRATSAGIRVVMITGDHKITAVSIAKEIGLYRPGDTVLTGEEIDTMSPQELSAALTTVSVFARVTPEHKLHIVNAYRARGEIIAMTGDGVNDAPSLVAADLGVAMGGIGTEVAKEAADIVLLDDNFGSIVSAIEEGRSIYKTIKKVILYLFSTNLSEVLTIVGALLLNYPLPLLPSQIIWLNFVTDGFLDVALAMEPKEKDLLRGNFERPQKYLIDWLIAQRIFIMAITITACTLFLFKNYYAYNLTKAWTIALTTLAITQWFNAWNCRSESKSLFQTNPFSNIYLIVATAIVAVLHLFVIYNPFMQRLFHTTPLHLPEWLLIISVALWVFIIEETRKFIYRNWIHQKNS